MKWFLVISCCLSFHIWAQTPLRVVTEQSPPHQTLINGVVAGLSTELVQATLAEAGLHTAIEIYPWARALHIAQNQSNVLIYNIARTKEREDQFHWIGEVAAYQLGFVKLSHRDDVNIASLSDATKYTVAVQRNDLAADFLQHNNFKAGTQLIMVADIAESWRLLLNGNVDLIVDDPVALIDMAVALNLPEKYVNFVYAIPELKQHTWLAASLNTSNELVSQLQLAHAKVAQSERYREIMSSSYHHSQ